MSRSDSTRGDSLPAFLKTLDSKYLLGLVGLLFVIDVVVFDPFPFVDEIVLGCMALLLARWQSRRKHRPQSSHSQSSRSRSKRGPAPGPGHSYKPPTKNVTNTV